MIYATGFTGTIGRHLPSEIKSCDIELTSIRQSLNLEYLNESRLIHLAGVVGEKAVNDNYEYSYSVNVRGTIDLAELFIENGGQLFVYVSSSHVYAKCDDRIKEDSNLEPKSKYAEQKLLAELGLKEVFKEFPQRLCIVRLFSILDWNVAQFTLGGAVEKIMRDPDNAKIRNCDDVRDFMTPKKAAKFLFQIARIGVCETINLCSGIGTTVSEAAKEMLISRAIKPNEKNFLRGNSEQPYIVGNPNRFLEYFPHADLSWQPSA